jgi:hypothetical protein
MLHRKLKSGVSWSEVLAAVQSHPDGVGAGCEAFGISKNQYYYHRARAQAPDPGLSFKEVVVPIAAPPCVSELEIRLRNGRSVIVRGEVSVSQLSPLLEMVEGSRC